MPTTTTQRFKERALETAVYLPLGAYDKARAQISELRGTGFGRLYSQLVDRGQDRVEDLEQVARKTFRRADRAEDRIERSARRTATKVGDRASRTTKKATSRATTVAAATAPKLPGVAAPRRASDLAIPGYASKTAGEIAAETKGLTQTQLAQIYKFEKAHEDRSTILEAIESKLIDLPIKTYDDLGVEQIQGRLERLNERDLKTLRRYELDTKARSTVIDRIDQLLA